MRPEVADLAVECELNEAVYAGSAQRAFRVVVSEREIVRKGEGS